MSRRTFVNLEIAFLLAIVGWVMLESCVGFGLDPFTSAFVQAYFSLVVGWSFFLKRVGPLMVIDWYSVGLSCVCLVGLVVGLHFFCAWLHREITLRQAGPEQVLPPGPTWKLRTTLSILGIVVLLFVAGIAAVGVVHQLVWLKTRQDRL